MLRFRFRIRSLMIVVAIGAVILGGETMRRRRATYLRRAAFEMGQVRIHQKEAEACERSAPQHVTAADRARSEAEVHRQRAASQKGESRSESLREEIEQDHSEQVAAIYQTAADEVQRLAKRNRAQADYHLSLGRKYQVAAKRPWWRAAADLPEPDWDALWPVVIEDPLRPRREELPAVLPDFPPVTPEPH